MNVLEVKDISKTLGRNKILKDISFSIGKGEIVGFVGPNGAGKTTTIRTITNLIFPDSGTISIFGYDLIKERENALKNVSAIVENPSLYTYLSGKDNLELVRKLNGISKEKMNEIIEFVDLTSRINDKVRKYSLGMKQRLALAMCLLTEPKLLILDEPTNGLDPTGTIELRNILIKLSEEKSISIFISSHILSEIEKICNKIIYIKEGQIVITKSYDKNSKLKMIKLVIEDSVKLDSNFKNAGLVEDYTIIDNELIISLDIDNLSKLLNYFAKNNIEYSNFEILNSKVEKEYAEIFGGEK
ncbi:ABC transporter ATP-binding protein [Clostridium sp. D2Q-14]|uniref:ABC transporter ATP-binding protein n=1 Tax=Anaeromonas gelatinilytica TaxID=2683194 RepID=UPI00193C253C|nr:ABC transporter ATP-binding protein [Anaeromonas gelatinilytica]MBS4534507.1 ABC transporter ATP-binding protein [Anaeromonas gelatinilytica]